jgi:hypothetical protein
MPMAEAEERIQQAIISKILSLHALAYSSKRVDVTKPQTTTRRSERLN